ncbi:MAG: proline iminopeptidase-family hydrolase [Bdellovibrionota bacterium]|nr:prolyl aminopeptidase [Pseudobdellovibrionaceae bacterium]|tara:strand:+ start:34399 stop:35256 length:858 start_codon:yes stop_codon:yes gene_type:complete
MAIFKGTDGDTYYIKSKKQKKTPMIFCHGGPGVNHFLLKPLLHQFKDRQIILFDQLGSGLSSSTTKDKWNIKTFVQQLKELVDHLELKEFILAGGSWGTTLALEYYLRTKDKRIRAIVFQSSMFSAKIWERDTRALIKKLPQKHQDAIFHCEKVGAFDAKVYQEATEAFNKKHVVRVPLEGPLVEKTFKHYNLELYNYMWGPTEFCPTGTLKNYDRVNQLSKIKVPTLFMCGEYDESTPKSNKMFSSKVKASEFKVLKSCSHISSIEKPKLYVKSIEDFLKRNAL